MANNNKEGVNNKSHTVEDLGVLDDKNHSDFNIGRTQMSSNLEQNKNIKSNWLSSTRRRVAFQFYIFFLTFCNYAILHATRATWSSATPALKRRYPFEIDTSTISTINACNLGFYAGGGIFAGHLADKFNKRTFIFVNYTLIGIVNILIGCIQYSENFSSIWILYLLQILNGLLQAAGWSTNLSILSNWFPKKGRGLLIGLWASNVNIGDIVGQQIYKVASDDDSQWGTTFIITGGMTIIFGLINFLFLFEYPSSRNIQIIESGTLFQKEEDIDKNSKKERSDNEQIQSVRFIDALLIPGVILMGISYLFIKFSMYGMFYWLPDYLQNELRFDKDVSQNIFSIFDIGAIVGNIPMGLITDFLPIRSPVFIVGIILATLFQLAISIWSNSGQVILSVFIFFLGMTLTGSSIVIAAIETDLGKNEILKNNQRALATVSGIIDGIAGFGSVLGQLLIGVVKDSAGWRATFVMLTFATGLAGVPMVIFMFQEIKERKKREQELIRSQNFLAEFSYDSHYQETQ